MSGPAAPCALCGCADTAAYCEKGGWAIRRCEDCGNGFLVRPASLEPEALYTTGYHRKRPGDSSPAGYDDYFAMESAFRRTFAARLREIVRLTRPRPGDRLLDVGCGPGYFLDLARAHFSVCGVELGSEAAAYARDRLRLEIREEPFRSGLFAQNSFSVVTLFDTLEHLRDPRAALRAAREALAPEGLLALTTGDFSSLAARLSGRSWHLLTPPEHLFYFTRRGLERILEREGFRVLSLRYPAGHFTCDYLLERLVKSLGLPRGYLELQRLRSLLKRVILPVNLFDIMLLTARKT